MESSFIQASLELFLDADGFCLRSNCNGVPYFEVTMAYEEDGQQILNTIDARDLDGELVDMFSGLGDKVLATGVPCTIYDQRTKLPKSKEVFLRSRKLSSSSSGSNSDSSPDMDLDF